MYKSDREWKYAKQVAKEKGQANNWIEVLSYYNELGGKNVSVIVKTEEDRYPLRLLGSTDNDGTQPVGVILYDTNTYELYIEEYSIVMEGKKEFNYIEEPKEIKKKLPQGYTFLEEEEITFYV